VSGRFKKFDECSHTSPLNEGGNQGCESANQVEELPYDIGECSPLTRWHHCHPVTWFRHNMM